MVDELDDVDAAAIRFGLEKVAANAIAFDTWDDDTPPSLGYVIRTGDHYMSHQLDVPAWLWVDHHPARVLDMLASALDDGLTGWAGAHDVDVVACAMLVESLVRVAPGSIDGMPDEPDGDFDAKAVFGVDSVGRHYIVEHRRGADDGPALSLVLPPDNHGDRVFDGLDRLLHALRQDTPR
jgi:hypothetical protein